MRHQHKLFQQLLTSQQENYVARELLSNSPFHANPSVPAHPSTLINPVNFRKLLILAAISFVLTTI